MTLVKEYARLWRNTDFMTESVGHWHEYESKHHKRSYKCKRTSASSDMVEKEVRRTTSSWTTSQTITICSNRLPFLLPRYMRGCNEQIGVQHSRTVMCVRIRKYMFDMLHT